MNIDDFELLFDEAEMDIHGLTNDQLFRIYGIFLNDFHKNPLILNGRRITFNTNKSRHPQFKGKYQGFVHLITRDNKYNDKRQYDRDRANRIHWVRLILENCQRPIVSYFEEYNSDAVKQYFYWVQPLDFIIILREVSTDLLLVTAYCVDNYNKTQYRNKLNNFRNR